MRLHRTRPLLLVVTILVAVLAALVPGGGATAAPGKPAPVKITLRDDLSGRVISDRQACVSERTVYGFGREGDEVGDFGSTQTDERGRYGGEVRRGDGPTFDVFTLVLGTARCRVAQSTAVRPSPPRQAAGLPKRKIGLQATPAGASGRVVSPRPGCVRRAPVGLFVRGTGTSFAFVGSTLTDRDGRYSFGDARLARGGQTEVLAVAFGEDGVCRVAQSPTRTFG